MSKEKDFLEAQMLYQKQIADLEAKLAEKDKLLSRDGVGLDRLKDKLNKTREELEVANNQILFDNKELERLKNQLAEKDKEILEVKNWWSYQYKGEIERKDQDKISFAVEQLEKAKGYFGELSLYEMYDKINNQIEELKKEMK